MKVLQQFCSKAELEELLVLWRSGTGWEARGTYTFVPCSKPPPHLVERGLVHLAEADDSSVSGISSFFLHYLQGQTLASHVDVRSGARLSVLVVAPSIGGLLTIGDMPVPLALGDAVVFSPCAEPYGISKIDEGEHLVWSLGKPKSETDATTLLTRKLDEAREAREHRRGR